MAIKDISKKPYIVDRDSSVTVGIDLPIRRGDITDGWFASTKTTIEAVKNNITNLLNTHQGERIMQPNLGLNLRSSLFEIINEESILSIQDSILDVMNFWLPFVEVRNIELLTNTEDSTIQTNEIRIKILFNIVQDPNTLESVTLNFKSDINESAGSSDTGGY